MRWFFHPVPHHARHGTALTRRRYRHRPCVRSTGACRRASVRHREDRRPRAVQGVRSALAGKRWGVPARSSGGGCREGGHSGHGESRHDGLACRHRVRQVGGTCGYPPWRRGGWRVGVPCQAYERRKGRCGPGARRCGSGRECPCSQRGRGLCRRSVRGAGPDGGRARGGARPVGRGVPAVRRCASPLSTGRGSWGRGRARGHSSGRWRATTRRGPRRGQRQGRWSGGGGGTGAAGPREAGQRANPGGPSRCNARLGRAV